MTEKITVKAVCEACKGTGLYQGMGERGGAFVQCYRCEGTGCKELTYEVFEKRADQPKCKRVYLAGGGYCIKDTDITTDEGRNMPFSQYGCTYEEWKSGVRPRHIEFLGCPMRMDQSACHKIKGFTDTCDELNGRWVDRFDKCAMRDNKCKCWERFYQQTTRGDDQ